MTANCLKIKVLSSIHINTIENRWVRVKPRKEGKEGIEVRGLRSRSILHSQKAAHGKGNKWEKALFQREIGKFILDLEPVFSCERVKIG